jgi:hypothetical protein
MFERRIDTRQSYASPERNRRGSLTRAGGSCLCARGVAGRQTTTAVGAYALRAFILVIF